MIFLYDKVVRDSNKISTDQRYIHSFMYEQAESQKAVYMKSSIYKSENGDKKAVEKAFYRRKTKQTCIFSGVKF